MGVLYFPLSPAPAKPLRSTKIGLGLFGRHRLAKPVPLTEQGAAVDFFAYFFHLQETCEASMNTTEDIIPNE